jgi:small subunit ribosomal protein S6
MQNYELTIITDGKATPAKIKSLLEKLEKIVKLQKGKLLKSENWGKRDFAYKINKLSTGNYLFVTLLLETSAVKGLREKLRMEEGIIRYLLVRE